MLARHELIGVYQGLKHPSCCWDNDDGTVAIIGKVEVEIKSGGFQTFIEFTIKGSIYPNQLIRGLTYRFFGMTKTHAKYGEQFVFDSFVVETPIGEDGVVAYLTQCRGIGPGTARAIYSRYGDDSVRKLREEPEDVANSVPRFSTEKAFEASEFLQKSERTERTKISLFALLKGRGFPKKIIDKVLDEWGAEAASMISRNPYVMMRFKGCGFGKTDRMYLDLGHNPARMKRQALCCWHSIASQSGGDTWFRFFEVQNYLRQNVASAQVDVERAMTFAVRSKLLSEKYYAGQRWVAEYDRDRQEQTVANRIDEARKDLENNVAPLIWRDIADELTDVTEHQKENARLATSGFIGVLAGRPGTGKTYTIVQIVNVLRNWVGIDKIAIAAPTGKAAVRVTSAMESAGLDLRASTLHSLLGFRENGFVYNRTKPLPHMFIVVDEASMLDTMMTQCLLDARAEGSHILFVGDPNQLAPVGHGAPLRDLIMANVPHGELKEIQRNGGRIVKACSEIIDYARLSTSPKKDLDAGENLLLIERDVPESQIDTLAAVVQKYQREFDAGQEDVLDPIWDLQIIVAVNANSEIGRKPLNAKLQDLLNPEGRRVAGNPFRVGDKIINAKNGRYKSALPERLVRGRYEYRTAISTEINADGEIEEISERYRVFVEDENGDCEETADGPIPVYVANGEQAEVIDVDTTKIIARLTMPDRMILIPRSVKQASEDGDTPDTGDDNDETSGSGCSWELGYAISCHKSQGSEWPIVIVMLDDHNGAKRVQSKQWIYTAISRAKRLCLMIGKRKTANEACQRDALFQRKTFLKERILDLREPPVLAIESKPIKSTAVALTDEILNLLLEGAY